MTIVLATRYPGFEIVGSTTMFGNAFLKGDQMTVVELDREASREPRLTRREFAMELRDQTGAQAVPIGAESRKTGPYGINAVT